MDDVLTETEGIVLIDEVDLHLHPTWQKRILKDLMEIFPKVQFIVSTHAPEVVNSVKRESVVVLRDCGVGRLQMRPSKSSQIDDSESFCLLYFIKEKNNLIFVV